MKQLICEMCGSNDLIKQDGVFVCQSCGCKYSVEEAKKMMVEGTVEVQGTVKVDNSDELNNLYQLARRAKDSNNNENAAKYYDMILIKDPSSWEANFYSIFYKSMSCNVSEISLAAENISNCIHDTMVLIHDNIIDVEERKKAVDDVITKSKEIYNILHNANLSFTLKAANLGVGTSYSHNIITNMYALGEIETNIRKYLLEVFESDNEIMSTIGITYYKKALDGGLNPEICGDFIKIIKKYEPDYEPPKRKPTAPETVPQSNNNSNSGGCYIATCVYGSYDCPQVWTLRRFRDNTLAETLLGRAFIRIYYAISPTLVKWFGDTSWFKNMWKGTLDRMVSKLQINGVEDTPYQDRNW